MGKILVVFVSVILAGLAPASAVVITVETLLDADVAEGLCSLREAIVAANGDAPYRDCAAGSGVDHIAFAVSGTVVLAADLPEITESLDLVGPAAGEIVIDGNDAFRPFRHSGGGGFALRLSRMTLLRGHAVDEGGCIAISAGGDLLELQRMRFEGCTADTSAGAIDAYAVAQTTIRESTFVGNTAGESAGAIRCMNFGALTIEDSTFSGNAAGVTSPFGAGGAIDVSFVDLVLRRSTVSGNSSSGSGGGLVIGGPTTNLIESSTIAGNTADLSLQYGAGGGIVLFSSSETTFSNTVVADNVDLSVPGGWADDIFVIGGINPPIVNSNGFNFIGNNRTAEIPFPLAALPGQANLFGDFVGEEAAPLDPQLAVLSARGGLTWTREPLPGSPLIDQGSCTGASRDQRGFYRLETGLRLIDDPGVVNFAAGCDIGAVELGATNAEGLLLASDFETGDLAAWSAAVP